MYKLTISQSRLLKAIISLRESTGIPPTQKELAAELGIKGPSVFYGLRRLEEKGYIRRQRDKARSIRVLYWEEKV